MTPSARQRGFTLLEVIVALAVAGVVLLGARALAETVADSARRIVRESADADATANGDRLLRALAGRLEVGTTKDASFGGTERAASFRTWCEVPAGWLERCEATIAVDSLRGTVALVALLQLGARREVVPIRTGFQRGSLRYLADVTAGGTWFRTWGAGITAPAAIGVILDADTLIVRIGERG